MDGLSKELFCNLTDPVLVSVASAGLLLILAVVRSVTIHGTRHITHHLLVGSDLILAVIVLAGVHAARIYQIMQCLGIKHKTPTNLASLNVALLVICVSLMLLIMCSAVERTAFQKPQATLRQIVANISLGFIASLCSIGVVAQQSVK